MVPIEMRGGIGARSGEGWVDVILMYKGNVGEFCLNCESIGGLGECNGVCAVEIALMHFYVLASNLM